ncbi:MAG TPA: metalloregulator ArsR/SmtB family transcription factor, partial [Steroidobacteraceae bacterium]|nr:metalloregulator ArsR/SmtB family transcription factor [Steroidobacteraceae bacterium]
MYSTAPPILVKWLRAAGEPSRLRLLALCADGALSVSDLAQVLKQSEPRVSRHLKILCEAGLLVRLRHGQWVHYRLAEGAEAASFVRGLLAQLDRSDPLLVRDRSGARAAVPETETLAHGAESRLGRALAELVVAGGLCAPLKAVLVFGVSHPELLESAARASQHCTAIAHSRRAAQSARAFAERRGFTCRVLRATSPEVLSDTDLARAGAPFDAVLLDTFASGETLARMLEHARRVLNPGGRLWIFERYESLERSRERIVEHPLARLRRLLGDAGLTCERLSPVEADGQHVLA